MLCSALRRAFQAVFQTCNIKVALRAFLLKQTMAFIDGRRRHSAALLGCVTPRSFVWFSNRRNDLTDIFSQPRNGLLLTGKLEGTKPCFSPPKLLYHLIAFQIFEIRHRFLNVKFVRFSFMHYIKQQTHTCIHMYRKKY